MSPSLKQAIVAVVALSVSVYAQEDQTALGDYIGAEAEDGTAVTSIYCPPLTETTTARNVLTSQAVGSTTFGWCNREGAYTGEIFTSCRGNVGYYRSTATYTVYETASDGEESEYETTSLASGTRDCGDTFDCLTMTQYDAWGQEPLMIMVGCANSLGQRRTTISEVYVTAASSVSEAEETSTTTPGSSSRGTTSSPAETETGNTDGSEDITEDNGDDTNIGLIVGASVGGVAGLALIIGGIFFAYRLGKKRKAHQPQPLPGNEEAMAYAGGSGGMQSPQWTNMQVDRSTAGYAPSTMTNNNITPPPREYYKPVGQDGTPSEIGAGDDHRSFHGASTFPSELSGVGAHDTAHEMPAVPATPRN